MYFHILSVECGQGLPYCSVLNRKLSASLFSPVADRTFAELISGVSCAHLCETIMHMRADALTQTYSTTP